MVFTTTTQQAQAQAHTQTRQKSASISISRNTVVLVGQLLEEQCELVEDYANAQTVLYNAITTNKTRHNTTQGGSMSTTTATGGILRSLERLDETRTKVRSNFLRLREETTTTTTNTANTVLERQQQQHRHYYDNMMDRHMGLSERVVGTISSSISWHANGLPAPNSGGDDTILEGLQSNTVAIAALRASVARIREIGGE